LLPQYIKPNYFYSSLYKHNRLFPLVINLEIASLSTYNENLKKFIFVNKLKQYIMQGIASPPAGGSQ